MFFTLFIKLICTQFSFLSIFQNYILFSGWRRSWWRLSRNSLPERTCRSKLFKRSQTSTAIILDQFYGNFFRWDLNKHPLWAHELEKNLKAIITTHLFFISFFHCEWSSQTWLKVHCNDLCEFLLSFVMGYNWNGKDSSSAYLTKQYFILLIEENSVRGTELPRMSNHFCLYEWFYSDIIFIGK